MRKQGSLKIDLIGSSGRKPSGGFKHSSVHYRDRPICVEPADKRLKSKVRQLATRPRGFDLFSMNWDMDWKPVPTHRRTGSPGPRSWAKSGDRRQPLCWSSRCGKLKHGTPCYCRNVAWRRLIQEPSWFIRQRVWSSQLPTHMHANQLPKHTKAPLNWPCGVSPGNVLCTENFSSGFKTIACLMEGKVRQDVQLTVQKIGWLVHWSHFWRCHKHSQFPRRPFPPRISAQIPLLKQIGNLLCTWACRWSATCVEPIQAQTQWCRDCWKMCSMRDRHNLATQLHGISQWLQTILPESLADNQDLTLADHYSKGSGPALPDKTIQISGPNQPGYSIQAWFLSLTEELQFHVDDGDRAFWNNNRMAQATQWSPAILE